MNANGPPDFSDGPLCDIGAGVPPQSHMRSIGRNTYLGISIGITRLSEVQN